MDKKGKYPLTDVCASSVKETSCRFSSDCMMRITSVIEETMAVKYQLIPSIPAHKIKRLLNYLTF